MNKIIITAAVIIIFLLGMYIKNLFYRITVIYAAFAFTAILIFKSTDELFLILVAGLVVNIMLLVGYKGYGTE